METTVHPSIWDALTLISVTCASLLTIPHKIQNWMPQIFEASTATRSNLSDIVAKLTIGNIDGQSAKRGFFVFFAHVCTGLTHCFDTGIQGNQVISITAQRQRCR